MVSSRHLQYPECDSRMLHAPQTLARQSKVTSVYIAGTIFTSERIIKLSMPERCCGGWPE